MTVTREEALEIFARRRATRAYDPDRRVSDEDFAAILEFARLSPSSVGTEPWKFLVIQDPELREKLKPIAWGMAGALDDASHLVVLLAKKGLRYDTPWMRRTLEGRNLTEEQMQAALERYGSFQKNDMKILESDRALFDWASKQTYIALGNMMTGAAMLGIDSCPIEGMNYEAVNELLVSAGLFDPEEFGVSVAVRLRRRAAAPSRTWLPGRKVLPGSRRGFLAGFLGSGFRAGRSRQVFKPPPVKTKYKEMHRLYTGGAFLYIFYRAKSTVRYAFEIFV